MFRRVDAMAALILVAAAVLRAHDLGRRSLWLDEAWAAIGALDGPFDVAHVRVTPLLFAGLVRLSVAVLGRSEVAVRLPAALFGIAAVLLAWQLGRQLVGVGGGRMAAAIVGLCPIPVYYGKELKAYSAELFLVLGLALVVGHLRRSPGWAPGWVALVASVVLGTGLSPIAPLLAAGAFVILLPTARRAPRAWLAAATACGVASLLWLRLVFAPQMAAEPGLTAYWHLFFLPAGPPRALATAALHSGVEAATWGLGTSVPHHADIALRLASLPPAAMFAAAACVVFGAVALWRRGGGWFVVLTLAWHGLIAAAAVAGRYPYGPARIALFLLGPTAILLGAAASAVATAVPSHVRPAAWLALALPLAWPLAGTWTENVTQPFEREELRPVLEEMRERRRPEDAVWVSYGATGAFRFYVPHPDAATSLAPPGGDVGPQLAASVARGRGRVWVIFGHWRPEEQARVQAALGALRVADRIEATGAGALLLVAPATATPPPG